MDRSRMKEYLQAIEDMVMDEGKIVTYKLLSRTLNLHVNTAKQLLYVYLLEQQKINPQIVSGTFLLAGLMKDGTYLVTIVNEDKWDETYSKFDKITSQHVYSIQKGIASGVTKNSQMLFGADLQIEPPKSYPIKYIHAIQNKAPEAAIKTIDNSVEVKTEAKSEETLKESRPSPHKEEKPAKNKKPGQISNFFSLQHREKVKKEEIKVEEVKSVSSKVEEVAKTMEECDLEELNVLEESPRDKIEKQKDSKKRKKKNRPEMEKKKRKRILSNSEESETDEEMRDAILCSEEVAPESSERLRIVDDDDEDLFQRKRKKRKTVDVNVVLEDGYLETRKEIVYETDSENESPKTEKEKEVTAKAGQSGSRSNGQSEGVKRKIHSSKGNPKKQQTLFSFFKKN